MLATSIIVLTFVITIVIVGGSCIFVCLSQLRHLLFLFKNCYYVCSFVCFMGSGAPSQHWFSLLSQCWLGAQLRVCCEHVKMDIAKCIERCHCKATASGSPDMRAVREPYWRFEWR